MVLEFHDNVNKRREQQEDEFHKLANLTINDLLEKIEVLKAKYFS